MGLIDAVKVFYFRYADFRGRASRSEYWWASLFMVLVNIAVMVVCVLSLMYSTANGERTPVMYGVPVKMVVPFFLLFLLHFIPCLALTARRLHDLDRSAWWYLLFVALCVIPVINIVFTVGWMLSLCQRGTIGDN